jgi:hypothetical protein
MINFVTVRYVKIYLIVAVRIIPDYDGVSPVLFTCGRTSFPYFRHIEYQNIPRFSAIILCIIYNVNFVGPLQLKTVEIVGRVIKPHLAKC